MQTGHVKHLSMWKLLFIRSQLSVDPDSDSRDDVEIVIPLLY